MVSIDLIDQALRLQVRACNKSRRGRPTERMVMSSSCLGQAFLLGEPAAVVAVVIWGVGGSETSIEPTEQSQLL